MNAQELEWNDLRFVLAVCREGTLSGAARELGVNHSTVFRRIGAIEEKLGVRLFERLPAGYAMTDAGEAVREVSETIEEKVLGLSRRLIGGDLRLHGSLRITAPDALAMQVLMRHMAAFSRTYPDIRLELMIANGYFDLTQREADIAIRATRSPPQTAVGRRLCRMAVTVYGTPQYLDSRAAEDLHQYSWLMPAEDLSPFPAPKWLAQFDTAAFVAMRTNSLLGLYEAVKQDLGVATLPCFLGDADPGLRRVIEPPDELTSELWVLTHADLRRTARVRAFMDHMTAEIDKEKDLIEGRGACRQDSIDAAD